MSPFAFPEVDADGRRNVRHRRQSSLRLVRGDAYRRNTGSFGAFSHGNWFRVEARRRRSDKPTTVASIRTSPEVGQVAMGNAYGEGTHIGDLSLDLMLKPRLLNRQFKRPLCLWYFFSPRKRESRIHPTVDIL
jgi:hypothetical protein